MRAALLALAAVLAALLAPAEARACSYIYRDSSYVDGEAPPGGTWWIPVDVDGPLQLRSPAGERLDAEIVSSLGGAYAIRVPTTAVPGETWALDGADAIAGGRFVDPSTLVVVAEALDQAPTPAPDVVVQPDEHALAQGWSLGVPNPLAFLGGDSCGDGLAFRVHEATYASSEQVVVTNADRTSGMVVDAWRTDPDEPLDVDEAPIVADGVDPALDGRPLRFPPTADDLPIEFDVHVRLRSKATGLPGETRVARVEIVGVERTAVACTCTATTTAPGSGGPAAVALAVLGRLLGRGRLACRRRAVPTIA